MRIFYEYINHKKSKITYHIMSSFDVSLIALKGSTKFTILIADLNLTNYGCAEFP